MTTLAVIVPARDAAPTIGRALDAVRAQLRPGDALIVVDDGSTDATAEIAAAHGATVLRTPRAGVGAARNTGAHAATADLLLFTDADATLAPGVLDRVRARLSVAGAPDALVGVYAARVDAPGVTSRFKNLWIRYTYLRAAPDVEFLFGCLCALPRPLFRGHGGFDTSFQRDTGGVDIELGLRLRAAGCRIRLDVDLEAVHARAFTVPGLLRNDHRRAMGYATLGLHTRGLADLIRRPRFANVPPSWTAGTVLVGVAAVAALATPFTAWGLTAWLAAAIVHLALHRDLLAFLWREGDAAVTLAALGLVPACQLAAGLGVLRGALSAAGGAARPRGG